jgi:hypothetical protein
MSDLDALDEVAQQRTIRVNTRNNRGKLGWSIPPNLERASASREGKAIEKPAALTPAEDEKALEPVTRIPGEGIATHYVHLIPLLRDRLAYFAIRYEDFDTHCDFSDGITGKCLGPAMVKRFGIDKLFDALAGSGLRLRVEEDPEQTAKMKARIEANYIPRQSNQARPNNHSHMSNALIDEVLGYLANKWGGLARLNKAVKQARSNHARRTIAIGVNWAQQRNSVGFTALLALPPPDRETLDACAEEEATAA